MTKSPDAFRTISEVADWLETPAHVLRFWESRFTQVKPVKRAGGRRYYRPADMALLGGIKKLLHDDGMTIRGVQKLLREHGVKYVASLSPVIEGVEPISAPTPESTPIPSVPPAPMAEMVPQDDFDDLPTTPEETVVPFSRPGLVADVTSDALPDAATAPDVAAGLAPETFVESASAAAEQADEGESLAEFDMTPHGFEPPAHVVEEDILGETSEAAPRATDFAAQLTTDSDSAVDLTPNLDTDLVTDLPDEIDEPAPESLFALRAEPEPAPKPKKSSADALPGQAAFDFQDGPPTAPAQTLAGLTPEEASLEAESLAEYEMPAPELMPHDEMADTGAGLKGLSGAEAPPEDIPDDRLEDILGDTPMAPPGDLPDLSAGLPDMSHDNAELETGPETEPDAGFATDFAKDLGADLATGITSELGVDLPQEAAMAEPGFAPPPDMDLSALSPDMGLPDTGGAPLGAALDLPPDPSDDDPSIFAEGGILGQLNARKLAMADRDEIAALLSRSEALSARLGA